MKERKSYKGSLKGVKGIWTDKKPRGLEVEKIITFYVPDSNKTFVKDGEYFDCVVVGDGVNIEDYSEIDDPRQAEEGKENVQTESSGSENSGE